jgi:hypothetical protein
MTRHQKRLLAIGAAFTVIAAIAPIADPLGETPVSFAPLVVAVVFSIFARAEARNWRRPLCQGQQLVLFWAWWVAFPAYLLASRYRRRALMTFLLLLVPILLFSWYLFVDFGGFAPFLNGRG